MRRNLFEQFEPLGADRVLESDKSRRIAAGSRQARHETGADRIDHAYENDRYAPCGALQRSQSEARWRDQKVRRARHQLGSLVRVSLGIIWAPANVQADVTAFEPAQLLQSIHKGSQASLAVLIVLR